MRSEFAWFSQLFMTQLQVSLEGIMKYTKATLTLENKVLRQWTFCLSVT